MSRMFDDVLNRDPMDAWHEIQELKAENERLLSVLKELWLTHIRWEGSEYWDKQDNDVSIASAVVINGGFLPSEESAGAATEPTDDDMPF